MPNGKKKLFFSTDTSLSGEEVLLYYRTRFQIEFCFRDAKGYTGLMDCQARDKWKLDFAFNASFTSLNVAKVTMKEMGMEIFYVFIQVTDDQHLSGETNF